MIWSKLKAFLRAAEARSHPALLQAIAEALAAITPGDAKNWFAHCGCSFNYTALARLGVGMNAGNDHSNAMRRVFKGIPIVER